MVHGVCSAPRSHARPLDCQPLVPMHTGFDSYQDQCWMFHPSPYYLAACFVSIALIACRALDARRLIHPSSDTMRSSLMSSSATLIHLPVQSALFAFDVLIYKSWLIIFHRDDISSHERQTLVVLIKIECNEGNLCQLAHSYKFMGHYQSPQAASFIAATNHMWLHENTT